MFLIGESQLSKAPQASLLLLGSSLKASLIIFGCWIGSARAGFQARHPCTFSTWLVMLCTHGDSATDTEPLLSNEARPTRTARSNSCCNLSASGHASEV